MNVRPILAKLRKEREAIDRAIAALEKIASDRPLTTKTHARLRNKAVVSHHLAIADAGNDNRRNKTQVISFPQAKRTG